MKTVGFLRFRADNRGYFPHTLWKSPPGGWPVSAVTTRGREALGFKGEGVTLYTIAVILLILWLPGFVGGYTTGAFIHVWLVVAFVLILVGF